MATLAGGRRIDTALVREERDRLLTAWRDPVAAGAAERLERYLGRDAIEDLDRFDRVQLADVISACEGARSLSAAGRELFAVSRTKKKSHNDADRLRKYLARFGLSWSDFTNS